MNNIKNFDEYFGRELEIEVLHNELNEKKKEGGIKGAYNRWKSNKVRKELDEEIEMSKNIIDGIKDGLDTLSNDFGNLEKDLGDKEKSKGESGKRLEEIKKIIKTAKDTSWDINELIDDGEIDYAGFVGNVAIAKARYFGVFLFPVTSKVLVHKGYNYFFALVRNTIRKALVMLQLNFDQFENLIISKSYQSDDYQEELRISEEIGTYYKELEAEIMGLAKKRDKDKWEAKLKAAKEIVAQKRKSAKINRDNRSMFDSLNSYENTYTKSLETLRQYTQDDVQKHLDAIKTSMTKLTAGDVDLTAFAELIIAAAEEHAYKVSSSIYNRFAKMTEVFSLPNQTKLLELIKTASDEDERERQKKIKEETHKMEESAKKEEMDELEKEGKKIFESDNFGGKLKLVDDGDYKYSVKDAGKWKEDDIYKVLLGDDDLLSDKEKKVMKTWFLAHPEVLQECAETLQMMFPKLEDFDNIDDYIEALTSIINDTLVEDDEEKADDVVEDGLILDFDRYYLLMESKNYWDKKIDDIKDFNELLKDVCTVNKKDGKSDVKSKYTKTPFERLQKIQDVINQRKKEQKNVPDWSNELDNTIEHIKWYLSQKKSESKDKKKPLPKTLKDAGVEQETIDKIVDVERRGNKKVYIIDFKDIEDNKKDVIKKLFVKNGGKDMEVFAKAALRSIGDNVIDYEEFSSRSEDIASHIATAFKDGKKKLGKNEYDVLKKGIEKLIDERQHDWPIRYERDKVDTEVKSEKKSEN